MGVGDHLVCGCPRQMRGGSQVTVRAPYSEHDKIGSGVLSLLQDALSGQYQIGPQAGVSTTGGLPPAPVFPAFAMPTRWVAAGGPVPCASQARAAKSPGLEFLCQRCSKGSRGQGFRAEIRGVNDLPQGNLYRRNIRVRTLYCGQLSPASDVRANDPRTGQGAWRKISSALDPSTSFSTPVRACVPTTSKSISCVRIMLRQTVPQSSFANVSLVGNMLQAGRNGLHPLAGVLQSCLVQ